MNRYERTTQLKPAAAAVAPITIGAVVCLRVQTAEDVVRSLILVALAAGFHLVVMRLVRDRGNAVQRNLWDAWGGSPTMRRLRWSEGSHAAISRLHRRVQSMTGVLLPDQGSERADSAGADDAYEDATARMRELTRNQEQYPRVYAELIQYGAARNLYGLKPVGIGSSAVAFVAALAAVLLNMTGATGWPWWPILITGAGALIVGTGWVLVITPKYVRTAADRYADALLATAPEPATTLNGEVTG